MSDAPWLTIIGLGEDGQDGLCSASRMALKQAEIVMGPRRHLDLLGDVAARKIEWPVPFADGLEVLAGHRGRQTVVLASGNPFWFGAGAVVARHFARTEWRAFPGRSTFSLVASRLGWPLETTACLGLHATPMARLQPMLAPGRKAIVLLRDGDAVHALLHYLTEAGFGESVVHVFGAVGGPNERTATLKAETLAAGGFAHPVVAAIEVAGAGPVLPLASGRDDAWFENDGQITKRPVRALTLSALAPRPFEHLWDIGSGSGSIAVEWLLADPSLTATAIEANPARAERIASNAGRFGLSGLRIVTGTAPSALDGLSKPDAVFVGGGLDTALLDWLFETLPSGTRLVANAVTLETEALLLVAHARHGGQLFRAELSNVAPIGGKRGWKAAFPIVQWSVCL